MAQSITLSVIVPFFNPGKYFKECLDSVLNVDFPGLEVICVDDGSTDDSQLILREFLSQSEKIKLLKNPKRGAGNARNYGLSKATGDYVFFLDADDVVEPSFNFEEKVAKASENELDILIFNANFWDGKQTVKPIPWALVKDNVPSSNIFSSRDVLGKLFEITGTEVWNKLYRREFLLSNSIKFQNLANANDVFFSFSALYKARKISCSFDFGIKYRIHTGSTQANKRKNPLCILEAIQALHSEILPDLSTNLLFRDSFIRWILGTLTFNFVTLNDNLSVLQLCAKSREMCQILRVEKTPGLNKRQEILLSYLLSKKKIPSFILTRELKNPSILWSDSYCSVIYWVSKKIKKKISRAIQFRKRKQKKATNPFANRV